MHTWGGHRQAPHTSMRCDATRKPLSDGTTARCMNASAVGKWQHGHQLCPTHLALVNKGARVIDHETGAVIERETPP